MPMRAAGLTAVIVLLVFAGGMAVGKSAQSDSPTADRPSRLAVLWTSGDPELAHRMAFMYTHNAKRGGWFDEVLVIVWGPSAGLLAGDEDLQNRVRAMMDDGVMVQACVTCADLYGVSDDLRALGIEVKPMGKPLSDMLQGDWEVLSL
ncbi:MAG: DsrE family protein [Candidatus Brocadiia bacterium]